MATAPGATGTIAAVIAIMVVLVISVSVRHLSDAFHARTPSSIILLISAPPAASPAGVPFTPPQRRPREIADA